jgi:hypothetical protein
VCVLRRSILALVLILAAVLGACTSPSGGGTDATAAPAGGATAEPAGGATAAPQEPRYPY